MFPLDWFRTSSGPASTLPTSSVHAWGMTNYAPENRAALGRWVREARHQAGFIDTDLWAAHVGRSTRVLLGLERGEQVGSRTITSVAEALAVDPGVLFRILSTGHVQDPLGQR